MNNRGRTAYRPDLAAERRMLAIRVLEILSENGRPYGEDGGRTTAVVKAE